MRFAVASSHRIEAARHAYLRAMDSGENEHDAIAAVDRDLDSAYLDGGQVVEREYWGRRVLDRRRDW